MEIFGKETVQSEGLYVHRTKRGNTVKSGTGIRDTSVRAVQLCSAVSKFLAYEQ